MTEIRPAGSSCHGQDRQRRPATRRLVRPTSEVVLGRRRRSGTAAYELRSSTDGRRVRRGPPTVGDRAGPSRLRDRRSQSSAIQRRRDPAGRDVAIQYRRHCGAALERQPRTALHVQIRRTTPDWSAAPPERDPRRDRRCSSGRQAWSARRTASVCGPAANGIAAVRRRPSTGSPPASQAGRSRAGSAARRSPSDVELGDPARRSIDDEPRRQPDPRRAAIEPSTRRPSSAAVRARRSTPRDETGRARNATQYQCR